MRWLRRGCDSCDFASYEHVVALQSTLKPEHTATPMPRGRPTNKRKCASTVNNDEGLATEPVRIKPRASSPPPLLEATLSSTLFDGGGGCNSRATDLGALDEEIPPGSGAKRKVYTASVSV